VVVDEIKIDVSCLLGDADVDPSARERQIAPALRANRAPRRSLAPPKRFPWPRNSADVASPENACYGWANFPGDHRPGDRRMHRRWRCERARHPPQSG
jgi:hypothetical protein